MKDKNAFIRLYRTLLLIRMTEEKLAAIYAAGEMRTPVHFSIGQEAVSAGICACLGKSDAVFASHRSHAAYLAKGGSLNGMIAELFGKITGTCKGRSGSAHLSSPGVNMFSAPILGGMIPVAAGAGLSFKMDRSKNIAVAFLGDAAPEEGVFAESVNFAALKKLPVLFVCENNLFSTHTHIRYRQPAGPLYKRVKAMGVQASRVDGNNAGLVYREGMKIVSGIRKGGGPYFLECMTYRWREHVGPLFDFENPYRTKAHVAAWMKKCPVLRLEKELVSWRMADDKYILRSRSETSAQIDRAIAYARASAWPKRKTLEDHVY